MRDLKGATVYRDGTLNREMARQVYGIEASSEGERLSISTWIPWGSGSSNVTLHIPPTAFRDLLFEMTLTDPAALFRAYASVSESMLQSLEKRAREDG